MLTPIQDVRMVQQSHSPTLVSAEASLEAAPAFILSVFQDKESRQYLMISGIHADGL